MLQKKLGDRTWLCWVYLREILYLRMLTVRRPVVQQENDYRQVTMLVDQNFEDHESLQEGDIVEYKYYYNTCIHIFSQ